ncbi:protein SCAI isoform X1 [Punica granatum]|uniref:Protein SCAI isoform X1 n=1 Tax=Punica granatum TaxID=22663 RepID=A0A6P8DHE1_PUNGR|nr:protein SCAI isoform X1 [Punica granatum]
MSQQQPQQQQHVHSNSSNSVTIPVSEVYWSLVDKADKKFSKIRDLPYYERHRYDTYFFKVFKVYTELWKFQQENRQKLVEAGLKRWEIGEIASRIAQLYYGQYMRTSERSYLSESYIFYEAIFTREYFREGLSQDLNLANKQLRFLARFLMVCLVLNKRETVHQLVTQLKLLLDECKRTFQETDFREWKLVVQEIVRFLKADTAFMNIRPLRYSLVLDPHPDSLPRASAAVTTRTLRLRNAVLSSYHNNEVKFSELTIDTFRMLQSLEWEPSGSFYQSSGTKMGASGPSRTNISQDIVDHTLPPNPQKVVLYRPSMTHLIAVIATVCEELPPDGVLLVYLSASGLGPTALSSLAGAETFPDAANKIVKDFQSHTISSDVISSIPLGSVTENQSVPTQMKVNGLSNNSCLQFGSRGNGGSKQNHVLGGRLCTFGDLLVRPLRLLFQKVRVTSTIPWRPLFLVIDSESSIAFEAISGAEKGEPAALLLSPRCSAPMGSNDSCRHSNGSLFTIFLTAPLQAFCILVGISSSEVDMGAFSNAEKLLSSSLNDWGLALAACDSLSPVWVQILGDPFLRRLLLRFIFCWAVLSLYAPTYSKTEFVPHCLPHLPENFTPKAAAIQTVVLQVAETFGAANKFIFSGVKTAES